MRSQAKYPQFVCDRGLGTAESGGDLLLSHIIYTDKGGNGVCLFKHVKVFSLYILYYGKLGRAL